MRQQLIAEFNGEQIQLEIKRKWTPLLEATIGSAYATLKRFMDGEWTAREITVVISLAKHGPDRVGKLALDGMRYGMPVACPYHAHPDVVAVIERDGHGNYADLAAQILEELIFGNQPEGDVNAEA